MDNNGRAKPKQAEKSDSAQQTGRRRGRKGGRKPKEENEDQQAREDAERAAAGDPDTPPPKAEADNDPINHPICPDGERIFRQHEKNPEIPLCPSIDAGHRCHKEGGPDQCPLWDRPKDAGTPEPEEAPTTPPKRTRKKRGES